MTAFEQAGSLLNGWVRSCWSCLVAEENEAVQVDQYNKSQGMYQVLYSFKRRKGMSRELIYLAVMIGVEREMQVCHTQPHLVPPMKLTVYDDLPSPGLHHERSNSLSHLLEEGRSLASRASHRASMSMHRRRNTMTPVKIGAPSDFRRVQSYQNLPIQTRPIKPTTFQPLELSIHRGGKRLSDLPEFDSFQADEGTIQRQTLAVPPRALSAVDLRSRRCISTASNFTISRKPVGSGDRCSSVINSESVIQQPPRARMASGLIPHFSLLHPIEIDLPQEDTYEPLPPVPTFVHQRSDSQGSELTLSAVEAVRTSTILDLEILPKEVAVPQTPVGHSESDDLQFESSADDSPFSKDSPSTDSSRTFPSRISSLRRPSNPAENRKTIATVPLPDRVSKWFFPEKASPPKPVSLAGENGFDWERTRTLSGTTFGSTTTTITGGGEHRHANPSVSSTLNNPFVPGLSMHGPSLSIDKTIESGVLPPRLYETRPQSRALSSQPMDHPRLNESTIGLAF